MRYLCRAGRGGKSQTRLPVREEWQVGRRKHMHVLMLTLRRPPLEDCCGLQAPSSPTRDSILIPQSDHRPTINVHCDGPLLWSCSSVIQFCLMMCITGGQSFQSCGHFIYYPSSRAGHVPYPRSIHNGFLRSPCRFGCCCW